MRSTSNKNLGPNVSGSVSMTKLNTLLESAYYKGLQTPNEEYESNKEKERIKRDNLNKLIEWFSNHL